MSNAPDDKVVNEYLGGNTPYSTHYQALEADDVPPEMDALILAQAEAAIKSSPPSKLRAWRRWSTPITLAATFVLVVSLVTKNVPHNPTTQLEEKIAAQGETLGETQKESAVKVAIAPAQSTENIALPALSIAEPKLSAPITADARREESRAAATQSAEKSMRSKMSNADKPAAPPPTATPSEVVVTGSFARSTPQDSALPVEVVTNEDLTRTRGKAADAAGPRGTIALPAPQAEADASHSNELAESIVLSTLKKTSSATGNGPRGTVPAVSSAERESSDKDLTKQQREGQPETWLKYIRDLRADGKQSAADSEWKNFRKQYPKFIVADNDAARGPSPK